MVNIYSMRTKYSQWASKSGIAQYMSHLSAHRYSIHDFLVPMGDELFPFRSQSLKEKITRKIRGYGNNIYDLNDLMAEMHGLLRCVSTRTDVIQYLDSEHTLNLLPSILRKLPVRRPKIVGMFHQPKKTLEELISPRIAESLDKILLMSNEQRPFFPDHLQERIQVILHGIDTDFFCPNPAVKTVGNFKCITVGNWLRDYDVLGSVAERFLGTPQVEFHIVANINKDNLPTNVHQHRNIPDSALLELYQGADVLVMPLTDATANNGILEGIACGLPAVVSDLPSTREYLKDAALFVKDNDVDGFESHIRTLLTTPNECRHLADKSRLRAEELDWKRIAAIYGEMYNQLVHGGI